MLTNFKDINTLANVTFSSFFEETSLKILTLSDHTMCQVVSCHFHIAAIRKSYLYRNLVAQIRPIDKLNIFNRFVITVDLSLNNQPTRGTIIIYVKGE